MGNNREELPTTALNESFADEIAMMQTGGTKSLLWVQRVFGTRIWELIWTKRSATPIEKMMGTEQHFNPNGRYILSSTAVGILSTDVVGEATIGRHLERRFSKHPNFQS
mmetsp:Transcript_50694/g.59200  ORF Transcript_50694/g.59200 Transcript_50694/m.59200 type:complete len:109 (-) Transcript_50694:1021-1347(-)